MARVVVATAAVLLTVICGIRVAGLDARTYEHARAVGKRCSTCHDSKAPHLANLNAAGKHFLTHRTLEGYKPVASKPVPPRSAAGTAAPGRAVYEKSCVVCHGPRGEGTPLAKPLTGVRQHAPTEAAAMQVIRNGIPGTAMAPFKNALTDQQIRDVARYVMTFRSR